MYLPDFLFEKEDIKVLKENNIFLRDYTDKINGNVYFKINNVKLNELIDFIYSNKNFNSVDKTNIEFKFRVIAEIYTAMIDNTHDSLLLTSMILNLYNIDSGTAKKLMSLLNRKSNSRLSKHVETLNKIK